MAVLAAWPLVAPLWAQSAVNPAAPIKLSVDATDAPRHLLHSHLVIPASPGPLTLLYPQWIPGEHGPTGPIADVVNLRFRANGQVLDWKRDSGNLYSFQVQVPPGTSSIEASFDFISPPAGVGGFSSAASMTTQLAVVSWNQVLLYPAGAVPDRLSYQADLRLPANWKFGTALPVANMRRDSSLNGVDFRPASLTTLIDSPVAAGAHERTIELGTADGAAHWMHLFADSEPSLAMKPELTNAYRRLVQESAALFGAHHYRSYHFLLTLSDYVASFGLEHHESSDNRLEERALLDENLRALNADLLAHEFVHSWNGKYRRPEGLVVKDYNDPMRTDLLWMYEGLTQYLGAVLAVRSGLETPELFRDWLAEAAGRADYQGGRRWRSLADTSISGPLLFDAREDYSMLRRGIDFYDEGALVWLDVDLALRKLSGGGKSIEDFCKAFHGQSGNSDPAVRPYALSDVLVALNTVQRNDWAGFFRERVDSISNRAPLKGLEAAGWKLAYDSKRTDYWSFEEESRKVTDLLFSIGLRAGGDGTVADVAVDGPAQKAGIYPGARITSVNGREFSGMVLRDAVQSAATGREPIEITLKSGEQFSTHRIDYHQGEKYPHLVRDAEAADLLAQILAPKARTSRSAR